MPFLSKTNLAAKELVSDAGGGSRSVARLPVCSNLGCVSGRLHLWRSREAPIFEGGWLCSPRCTRASLRAAVIRELKGRDQAPPVHRHRIPLGLVLLSQRAITRDQLRSALARQRSSGGRLGTWLEREHGVPERAVTSALGAQWGVPVLSLDNHSPEKVAWLAPRLFLDAFEFLPLHVAGSVLLYVGYEDRIDRCINLALERMTGLRVEAGVVPGRAFTQAHRLMLTHAFPPSRMIQAGNVDGLIETLTQLLEERKPSAAKLVRMHNYLWMRMWKSHDRTPANSAEDIVCIMADSSGCE